MFKRRSFHTLQDIRKILIFIPPIFVFFIAIISIFLSSLIIENNQQNQIDLLVQEEQFNKKQLLSRFIEESRDSASSLFDKVERKLNHSVYEASGYIKASSSNDKTFSFSKVQNFMKKLEKENNIQFVFFNSKTFEIIYGENIVRYLQTLTNSNITSDSFRVHILKNIQFLGNKNLQYWLDKNRRNIRLSYFEEIEALNLYFGAFSNVDDMRVLLQKSIVRDLVKKSKGLNSYFWFYDYSHDLVYNYNNLGKIEQYKDLMEKSGEDESKKTLRYYHSNKRDNITLNEKIFNFPKYQYLVAIKDSTLSLPNDTKAKILEINLQQ